LINIKNQKSFLEEIFPSHKDEYYLQRTCPNIKNIRVFLGKVFAEISANLKFYQRFLTILSNAADSQLMKLFPLISNKKHEGITKMRLLFVCFF